MIMFDYDYVFAHSQHLPQPRLQHRGCRALQSLFSQFSKSWILTMWVIPGFRTLTVMVVRPFPMSPPSRGRAP
jgi:hypothetical protein